MKKLFVVTAFLPLMLLGCGLSQSNVEGLLTQENSTKSKTKLVKNLEDSTVDDKINQVIKYLEMITEKRTEESRQLRNYRSMSYSGDIAPLLEASEKGEASAMYALGIAYFFGSEVVKNDNESSKWVLKAASLGHTDAQAEIGHRYAVGLGVIKDDLKAIEWYRKAIKQGSPEAMSYLAWNYSKSIGVKKNIEIAYSLYQLADNEGLQSARERIQELEQEMTQAQISTAKKLATDCVINYFDNCG